MHLTVYYNMYTKFVVLFFKNHQCRNFEYRKENHGAMRYFWTELGAKIFVAMCTLLEWVMCDCVIRYKEKANNKRTLSDEDLDN